MGAIDRDLAGYRGRYPDIRWPGGAGLALSFVLNVEEGAELLLASGDERNESRHEVNHEVVAQRGPKPPQQGVASGLHLGGQARGAGISLRRRGGRDSARGQGHGPIVGRLSAAVLSGAGRLPCRKPGPLCLRLHEQGIHPRK